MPELRQTAYDRVAAGGRMRERRPDVRSIGAEPVEVTRIFERLTG